MPAQPKAKKKENKFYSATGKRKTSVARVRLFSDGKGEIKINEKPLKEFCQQKVQQDAIMSPLELCGMAKKVDLSVKVLGGGIIAQADAIRHGVARALLAYDEMLRATLKKAGFLTRDARIKERKKFGLKRARRAPQFSKR
ncbi:30S ribosomal protein S9 [Candidatus Peregrinibacteria bacterium]|nr:30S ribosomal protein S9 [Candidatus Peregrinibacteria bacterium]